MRKPERFSRASTSTSIPNRSKGSSGTETDASRRCRTYSHAPGRDSVTAADSSKPNPVTNENRRPTLPSRFSSHFFLISSGWLTPFANHSLLAGRRPARAVRGTRSVPRCSQKPGSKTPLAHVARSRSDYWHYSPHRAATATWLPSRFLRSLTALALLIGSVGSPSGIDRRRVRSHRQPLSTGPVRGTVVSHFGSSPIGGRQIPADSHDSPSHELPSSVTRPPTASPVTGSRATPAAPTPCTRPLPARTYRTGCPFPRETPRETH